MLAGLTLLVVATIAGLLALSFFWPSARLRGDSRALARLSLAPAGERVSQVSAVDEHGRRIALVEHNGRVLPVGKVTAGERLTVTATVRRAGWVAWLVGKTRQVETVVVTPRARLTGDLVHPALNGPISIRFDSGVNVVTLQQNGSPARLLTFSTPRTVVSTGLTASGEDRFGNVLVAAAPRAWERLSQPVRVSWFPAGAHVEALVRPAPGSSLDPTAPIQFSFSVPIANLLGRVRPAFVPATPGSWSQTASNVLVFHPAGAGFPLGSHVSLTLPTPTDVVVSGRTQTARTLSWHVPVGTTLRLEQLLGQLGYLPLSWQPSQTAVARTPAAQVEAALRPPEGTFNWRYPNTPPQLKALWSPGGWTRMTQGAVMAFQHDQGVTVDGIPGPQVWHKLLAEALADPPAAHGYSYVLVHRTVPQNLLLWHDGQTILHVRINTGVPRAPTPFGTHAVFEHIPIGTMRGVNPDGSRYVDHGILWISYFNGGEAIHGFDRPTYGYPQSVGCVEAPNATAKEIWPYTPIGTLVTIVP